MSQYSSEPASLTEVSAGTGSSATETDYEGLDGISTSSTDNLWGLAIDGLGNIWFANSTGNGLIEFNPFVGTSTTASGSGTGTAVSESGGFTPNQTSGGTGNLLASPQSVAVDSAGAIWVSNYDGTSVVQILGRGAPTQPLLGKQNFGKLP